MLKDMKIKIAIISLWYAFIDLITWNFATKETAKQRFTICGKCEMRDNNRCTICGCYLPAKVKLKNSECPAGEW